MPGLVRTIFAVFLVFQKQPKEYRYNFCFFLPFPGFGGSPRQIAWDGGSLHELSSSMSSKVSCGGERDMDVRAYAALVIMLPTA